MRGAAKEVKSPSEGTEGEAFVSFVESTGHSCFSVKKKEKEGTNLRKEKA